MEKEDTVVRRTGAKLRHFRILKGISQEQLALDCDLNINTIGMIERGQKNPTIYTLQRICDGLGITLATLFLYDESSDTAAEDTIQRIEAVLRQMPRQDVERVARIVEEVSAFLFTCSRPVPWQRRAADRHRPARPAVPPSAGRGTE